MSTCSPVPIPGSATPAPLGPAAPSSARAVYLQQKRSFTARRGADVFGGVAVPRINRADALELVAAWSSALPALVARLEAGTSDLEIAEWARCALAVRALAGEPAAELYADRIRLWRCLGRIASAMDRRNVAAPSWSDVTDAARRVGELVKLASAAAADAKGGANNAALAIGAVSDAMAGGAAKVSAAAGRGAGEGAIRGALTAAAPAAAVAGVALVGGLLLWRASRNDNREPSETAPRKARKRTRGRR